MIRRLLALMVMLSLGLQLGACSQTSAFVADHWPHWAGGMPDDVPPRPGAPGYDEFIAHRPPTATTATPAAAEKANAPASPAGAGQLNDKDATKGGVY